MVYNCTYTYKVRYLLNLKLFLLMENLYQLYFRILRTSRYLLNNGIKMVKDERGMKNVNIKCFGCHLAII